MRFANGTTLGSYEILEPLGAGGMGEVYRARDTRLGREVAIKVLPDLLARDPERRARFEREAQAVAALSHANILAIHDFGVDGDTTYAVMELLDGETLGARLTRGPLSVRKAIEAATGMARGLAAAHGKGIVHRDLKPDNVFLLADGQVKILDFGLARTAAGSASTAETVVGTDPGVVMGTVGYMSPEQVRGQMLDARSDLFSLGCVLYEMLSGRRAFARDTAAETMTAILKDDPPDLQGTRTDLSPALDRIVGHCLEKNPAERFQTARDVAFALEGLSGSAGSAARAVPPATSRRPVRALVTGAVLLSGLAAAFVLGRSSAPVLDLDAIRFEAKTFAPQLISNARFLPDGRTIVFSAALDGSEPELFVSRSDSAVPRPLGHKRTHLLSVSSTGELAVLTDATFISFRLYSGTLARVPMDGAPRAWMTAVREADWSPDGSTLALVRDLDGRDRLEYPIGQVLYEAAGYLSDLRVSPRSDAVAFLEHPIRFDDRGWLKVVDRSGSVRTLAGEYWGMQGLAWTPEGEALLFSASQGGAGNYQPYRVPAAGGAPVRRALASAGSLWIQDVAKDGGMIMLRSDDTSSLRARLPGDDQEREFSGLESVTRPHLSPDGSRLLFSDVSQGAGANYAAAYRDTSGGQPVRLGEGAAMGFSPDAAWALASVPSPPQLVLYPLGPGNPVRLERGAIEGYQQARWFPDGKHVLFCGSEPAKPPQCYRQAVAGGHPTAVTPGGFVNALAAPDGRTLAALSAGGDWQILTIAGGPARPAKGISRDDRPITWAQDGRSIFVLAGTAVPGRIERVDPVTGERTFVREIAPQERAGLVWVGPVSIIGDGAGYAYEYFRNTMTLYGVQGMK